MTKRILLFAVLLGATASAAEAHIGVGGTAGFAHGFSHPFSGLDHLLAMVTVGLFAAKLGGRAWWLVPAAFLTMMAAGGALGISGVGLPFVEIAIALSVIVLGTAVAVQWSLPLSAAMALAGFFAVFHGHAHGAEMPVSASGLSYALGFISATASLQAIGIGLGIALLAKAYSHRLAQLGGGAMALAGLGILTGVL